MLHDGDLPLFSNKWDEMITKHKMVTAEVRMKTPVEVDLGSSAQVIERWILASVVPEIGTDGCLMSLMGCKSAEHESPCDAEKLQVLQTSAASNGQRICKTVD